MFRSIPDRRCIWLIKSTGIIPYIYIVPGQKHVPLVPPITGISSTANNAAIWRIDIFLIVFYNLFSKCKDAMSRICPEYPTYTPWLREKGTHLRHQNQIGKMYAGH